jgi:hypothetical protein
MGMKSWPAMYSEYVYFSELVRMCVYHRST